MPEKTSRQAVLELYTRWRFQPKNRPKHPACGWGRLTPAGLGNARFTRGGLGEPPFSMGPWDQGPGSGEPGPGKYILNF